MFTSEWDKYSQKTYQENFGGSHEIAATFASSLAIHRVYQDTTFCWQAFLVSRFRSREFQRRTHWDAPTAFSATRKAHSSSILAQIIAHHKPPAFLLENVKNLERHDKGRTFATILNVLKNELGYNVSTRVVSSEPWVPQKRERVFLVGFRDRTSFDFDKLIVPEQRPKLGSILEDHANVDPKYTLTQHLWGYLQAYKETTPGEGQRLRLQSVWTK